MVNKKQIEDRFDNFLKVYKLPKHKWVIKNKRNVAVLGYTLDYNPTYGGYKIAKVISLSGGESEPFGSQRFSASVFDEMLKFAIRLKQR
jgi:hypothetical protein